MYFRCVRIETVLLSTPNRVSSTVWTSPWVLWTNEGKFDTPLGDYFIGAFTLPEKGDSDFRAWSHCESIAVADSCIALNSATFDTMGDYCSFELFHQDKAEGDGSQGKQSLGSYRLLKTGIAPPTTSTILVIGPKTTTTTSAAANGTTLISNSSLTIASNATDTETANVPAIETTAAAPVLQLPLIIGVSLAGVGFLAMCLAIIVICVTRRRRRVKQKKPSAASPTPTTAGVMSVNESQEFVSMRGGGGGMNQQRMSYAPSYGYAYQQPHQQQQYQYQKQPPQMLPVDGDVMANQFVTSEDFAVSSKNLEQRHSRRRRGEAESGGDGGTKRVHKKRSGRHHDNRSHVSAAETAAAEDAAEAEELRGIDSNHVIDYAELEMLNELGSGSFGVVWRAKWRGVDVAVKEVLGESGKAALISEVAKMQHLRRHPNICSYFGCTKRPLALVVEFCNGGALDERALALNSTQQTAIAIGIASGVRHLHLELVVHRDLAARNILLEVDGDDITPKVADFGMARVATGVTNQTKTDVGPLKWMAPEQLATLQYSEKSDVWSFGVVLYEMYACDMPWADISPPMAAHKIVSGELLPIDATWPTEVRDVMRRCWEYEPAARPRMTAVYDSLIALRRAK